MKIKKKKKKGMRHCWRTLWPVDFFQTTQKMKRFSEITKKKNTLHKVNEKQTDGMLVVEWIIRSKT